MIIKIALSFPTESAAEMGRRMQQGGLDWPDYLTVLGPYFFVFMHEGFRCFLVCQFDESRMAEALKFLRAYPARYYGVPGFTYLVEIGSENHEKMSYLGLE